MIGIRVSGFIPIQSAYLPLISLYFFLSLLYSMVSFMWFIAFEMIKSKKYQLKFLKRVRLFSKNNKVHNESNNDQQELEKNFSLLNKIAFTLIFLIMSISFICIWSFIIFSV